MVAPVEHNLTDVDKIPGSSSQPIGTVEDTTKLVSTWWNLPPLANCMAFRERSTSLRVELWGHNLLTDSDVEYSIHCCSAFHLARLCCVNNGPLLSFPLFIK